MPGDRFRGVETKYIRVALYKRAKKFHGLRPKENPARARDVRSFDSRGGNRRRRPLRKSRRTGVSRRLRQGVGVKQLQSDHRGHNGRRVLERLADCAFGNRADRNRLASAAAAALQLSDGLKYMIRRGGNPLFARGPLEGQHQTADQLVDVRSAAPLTIAFAPRNDSTTGARRYCIATLSVKRIVPVQSDCQVAPSNLTRTVGKS